MLSETLQLLRKGYIRTPCKSCGKTTFHSPKKVKKGFVLVEVKYFCLKCGSEAFAKEVQG